MLQTTFSTEARSHSGNGLASSAASFLALACSGLHLEPDGAGRTRGHLHLRRGDRLWIALTYAEDRGSAAAALDVEDCDKQLKRTLEYWHDWASQCTYQGPYRDLVVRSALALKLMTYEPTGAIVAAPTTSLPERLGGGRNWDYGYTCLRDSSFILYALLTIGYVDEAADFTHWLERTLGSDPGSMLRIMYGIDGRTNLPEHTLDHLDGYCGSHPVRTGNAAVTQCQLDVFGEVLRAPEMHYRRQRCSPRRPARPPSSSTSIDGSVATFAQSR